MTPELKAAWIEALRSGRYPQGRYGLRSRAGAYCCLGVLCDVSGMGEWVDHKSGRLAYAYRGDVNAGSIPSAMLNAIGMGHDRPGYFILMNDQERQDFAKIADWIEGNMTCRPN